MSTKEWAEALRSIAQNDYMIDSNYLPSGETLNSVAHYLDSEARRYEDSQKLQDIGRNTYECLAEMVAALECDYDRLEELKQERADIVADGAPETEDEYSDLQVWDNEHADELADLVTAAGDCESREHAETRIQEDPLSIELTGTWVLGETPTADRALILLGTGGPATRIVCELNDGEPTRAWLQAQDWGTPWTDYTGGDSDTLLTYCQQFYFGG